MHARRSTGSAPHLARSSTYFERLHLHTHAKNKGCFLGRRRPRRGAVRRVPIPRSARLAERTLAPDVRSPCSSWSRRTLPFGRGPFTCPTYWTSAPKSAPRWNLRFATIDPSRRRTPSRPAAGRCMPDQGAISTTSRSFVCAVAAG
eukprot:1196345-Prorocentrum_minimum.AAC.1